MADQAQVQAVQQVPVDENGRWEATIPPTVTDGLHRVEAIDDLGDIDDALLYVDRPVEAQAQILAQSRPTIIERVLPTIPPAFAYALFFFIILVLLLALNGVRIARRGDRHDRHPARTHHRSSTGALVVGVIAVIIALLVGVALNRTVGALDRFFPARAPEAVVVSVAGAVVDAYGVAVSGADLVVGDTRIRTDIGGQYAFEGVNSLSGVQVTHPSLARALSFVFPDAKGKPPIRMFPVELVVDAQVIGLVSRLVEADAAAKTQDIYALLSSEAKQQVDAGTFVAKYPSLYSSASVGLQDLQISHSIRLGGWKSPETGITYTNVVELELMGDEARGMVRVSLQEETPVLAW